MLDILLMMSVWLVVMVYLSKLATPAIAMFHLYLPITFYSIFVLTFLRPSCIPDALVYDLIFEST